jgi:hypothetical protein
VAGERAQARDGHQQSDDQNLDLDHPSSVKLAEWIQRLEAQPQRLRLRELKTLYLWAWAVP